MSWIRVKFPANLSAGILAVCVLSNAANTAQAELYGHWPLDDGSGGVARDLGPRGVDGTIADFDVDGLAPDGSVWVDDPDRGTVIGLGGNSAWVEAGFLPLMDLENDFSWSYWARQPPTQTAASNAIVVGNRWGADGSDTSPREFIKFTPRRFEYHMNGGGRNDIQYDDVGSVPSNDEWIHHSLVKDGDQLTYYRNGEFGNSNTLPTGQQSAFPLPFGMGGQYDVETWRGYLSDVQLYETALTQENIQNSVMAGDEVAGADLYARYQLNDGAGAVAAGTGPGAVDADIIEAANGGLGDGGSVWVEDPDRGTVVGLADSAWISAGELPIMDLDVDFTWNFWARQDPDQPSPNNDIIIGNRYDSIGQVDTVPAEWIKFTPNRVEFHMDGSGAGDVTYVDGQLGIPSNDEWISHIVVKDGDQLAYYRDGVLENSDVIVDPMSSPDPLPFGLGGQDGRETWQGYLSDVRLYDHALSQAEIDELTGNESEGIAGDYNNSGQVEQGDLDLVLLNWGDSIADPIAIGWTNPSFPPDGAVDQGELDGVLLNWGNAAALGSSAAVPEPGTSVLLILCVAILARFRFASTK